MAKAIPPPNNNKIPQGNCTASFQSINFSPFLLGMTNRTTAAIKAMMESSIAGIQDFKTNDLLIQANAVHIKTVNTSFSSRLILPNLVN